MLTIPHATLQGGVTFERDGRFTHSKSEPAPTQAPRLMQLKNIDRPSDGLSWSAAGAYWWSIMLRY